MNIYFFNDEFDSILLQLVGGPSSAVNSSLGRIYNTSLGKLAAFHETAIRNAAGPPQKTKEQLEEEKLERKLKASQAKAQKRSQKQMEQKQE